MTLLAHAALTSSEPGDFFGVGLATEDLFLVVHAAGVREETQAAVFEGELDGCVTVDDLELVVEYGVYVVG